MAPARCVKSAFSKHNGIINSARRYVGYLPYVSQNTSHSLSSLIISQPQRWQPEPLQQGCSIPSGCLIHHCPLMNIYRHWYRLCRLGSIPNQNNRTHPCHTTRVMAAYLSGWVVASGVASLISARTTPGGHTDFVCRTVCNFVAAGLRKVGKQIESTFKLPTVMTY